MATSNSEPADRFTRYAEPPARNVSAVWSGSVVHGHEHELDGWTQLLELASCVELVQEGHGDIKDHHVRSQLLDRLDERRAIVGDDDARLGHGEGGISFT